MTMTTMLHADGSVRFATEQASEPAQPDPLVQLGRGLEEFQMSRSRVWMARELVQAQPNLSEDEQLAAVMLVLLVMLGQQDGSTRFPVAEGHEHLPKRLEALLRLSARAAGEAGEEPIFSAADAARLTGEIRDLLGGGLNSLVGTPQDYKPLIRHGDMLYTERSWQQEQSVGENLRARIGRSVGLDGGKVARALDQVLAAMPFDMSSEELANKRAQVSKVLSDNLGVISGGPGTGKTTLVLTVLRVLVRLGGIAPSDLLLAAPTGKAAKRMRESIDHQFRELEARLARQGSSLGEADRMLRAQLPDPMTLHRMLRYSPYLRGFRHNAEDPVVAKYVVVDEASMIDLRLMDALLDGVADETRILLIGDADQLPAVGAGAVFRHLSPTGEDAALELPAAVRLTETHRSVPEIERVAEAINAGSFDCERALTAGDIAGARSLDELSDRAIVGLVEPEEEKFVGAFAGAWFGTHVDLTEYEYKHVGDALAGLGETLAHRSQRLFIEDEDGRFTDEATAILKELFAFFEASRVLCATRKGPTGSETINRHMHRLFRSRHGLRDSARFRAGEPVMVVRNDYDNELFNGDQGIVLYTLRADEYQGASSNAKKRVVFRDGTGFRAVALGRIRDRIELSYAMTVHKSQGSEYDHVALLLPDDPENPLLTREVLYTGITRAKRSVTVLGRREILQRAAERKMHRFSGLRDLLGGDQKAEVARINPSMGARQ